MKLDADVKDDKPPPESTNTSQDTGSGVAPWLILGGAVLVIAALGPFRSRLLRLVRRS